VKELEEETDELEGNAFFYPLGNSQEYFNPGGGG
jgi:hypothetical protein